MSLSSRPLYLDIADVIREKIFQHQLKPGAWINEKEITQELEISRTPLREAIKVLAAEGLVTMKLRRVLTSLRLTTKTWLIFLRSFQS